MTILPGEDSQAIINIFEIWPTFIDTPTKSLPTQLNLPNVSFCSFSSALYQVAVIIIEDDSPVYNELAILDIQNSNVSKLRSGTFGTSNFSPDGSLLVASESNGGSFVWKYHPEGGYTKWIVFPAWSDLSSRLKGYLFSPTLSSVLILREDSLEMKHLDNPSTAPLQTRFRYYEGYSIDGIYVVTAPSGEQTVTITNLNGIYSQSIKTGFKVAGLALTNNILLVHSFNEIAVWRLTKEGMVDGVSGGGISNQDGRLWTKPMEMIFSQKLQINGRIGAIKGDSKTQYLYYNTETGEELESVSVKVPPCSASSWKHISTRYDYECQYSFSHHDFSEHDNPSEDDLPVSIPWYKEGWVKYPEGKYWHKFWLPVHWSIGGLTGRGHVGSVMSQLSDLKWTLDLLSSSFTWNPLPLECVKMSSGTVKPTSTSPHQPLNFPHSFPTHVATSLPSLAASESLSQIYVV